MTTPSQAQMTPQERFRIRHRERIRQKMAVWREANREKTREYGRQYWKKKLSAMTADELAAHRSADVAKAMRNYQVRKDAIFSAYGGYVCKCCGEKEKSFLSVDHVHNNAQQMIRDGLHKRGSASFYNWLVKNKFPPGFQILCMNCQFGKKNNGGVCPHQGKV